jgi:hypothetical protein
MAKNLELLCLVEALNFMSFWSTSDLCSSDMGIRHDTNTSMLKII